MDSLFLCLNLHLGSWFKDTEMQINKYAQNLHCSSILIAKYYV